MADDLWTRVSVNDELLPWICSRCGVAVIDGQPRHALGGLRPREMHTLWHARLDALSVEAGTGGE